MVADQARDRVARVVFVDSNLPYDGQSMIDSWSENGQRLVRADIAGNGGVWPVLDAADLLAHDLTDAQAEWLVSQSTPHPGRTLLEPAALSRPLEKLPATYIVCTQPDPAPRKELEPFVDHWQFIDLNTGHWPMVSAPDTLAEILHRVVPAA
jgi:pimeloyl-ACP methyl ester carboxylesterase